MLVTHTSIEGSDMQHWHVNHNMPGYLPEADGMTVETWDEAQSAFREEIGRQQEYFSENCSVSHETAEESNDCLNGGENRCGWQDLYVEAEMDRQTNATPHNFHVTYCTPEGADVVFMTSCVETDCVLTWDED